jgi:hypothetical protein
VNKTRHIGGSLLPSSSPRVLAATEHPFGILQVRALPDADTHALFLRTATGETMLATHPNGYSCRALAGCMAVGNVESTRDQVNYILACGGTARHIDHIINAMLTLPLAKSKLIPVQS